MAIKEHADELHSSLLNDTRLGGTAKPLPKGSRFYTHEVPESVFRELKPHPSDWRKLDANQARNLGDNPNFKFFSYSHGKWSAVRDGQTASRSEQWLAFVRAAPVNAKASGGGGSAATALTKSDLDALQHYAQAMAVEEKPAAPIKMPEYRKLTIIVLPGNPDAPKPVRFSINGAQGAKQVWGSSGTKKESYTFERIPVDGTITLTASANGQSQALVATTSHGNVMDTNRYRFPNEGNGPLLYVLNHELQGTTPVITVSPELPQFGVFFDGTGNNMSNDLADPNDDKAPTNVVKLYELYPRQPGGTLEKAYSDGVGTQVGRADSNIDLGFATSFGERIHSVITKLQKFAEQYPLVKEIYVDTIGFSRGAAQARAFVNEVRRLSGINPMQWGGARIQFRFMGLFDTVGSVGWPGDDDDNNLIASRGLGGPIDLSVAPAAVQQAVQFTAMDEYRHNFPLTSLRSADGSLPGNFIEEAWPGAHSDIGGGYAHGTFTIHYPIDSRLPLFSWADEKIIAQEIKEKDERKYWKPGIDIQVHYKTMSTVSPSGVVAMRVWEPTWQREVRPELSHITLARMHALAKSAGVPFEALGALRGKGTYGYEYLIPEGLMDLVNTARQQERHSPAYDMLYREYIHHSHQYGPELSPHIVEAGEKRTIYPNPKSKDVYNDAQMFDEMIAP